VYVLCIYGIIKTKRIILQHLRHFPLKSVTTFEKEKSKKKSLVVPKKNTYHIATENESI
jgi:hypothetical protein